MNLLLKSLPLLFFTYALSSWVVYMALVRVLTPKDEELPKLFVYTLGTGPLLISLFLWPLYAFLPGQPDWIYISAIVLIFAIGTFGSGPPGWQSGPRLWQQIKKKFNGFDWRANMPWVLLVGGVGIFLIVQLVCSVLMPIYGSDQSQYALVSALGYARKTFDFYPLKTYDPQTGYFDLSDHPPAYYFLKIWHYTLQGSSEFAGISKFIEPMYMICLVILVGFLLLPYGLPAVALGVLGMTLVPGLMQAVKYHAIDPFRLLPFLLCMAWLREALEKPEKRVLMISGLYTGLSMFPHSIGGLLSIPAWVTLYGLLSRQPWHQRIAAIGLAGASAIAVGGWHYAANALHSGSPIAASLPLLDQVKAIDYYNTRMLSMGIHGPASMVWLGILKQFSNLKYFGIAAWATLLLPFCCRSQLRHDRMLQICALMSMGFLLLMVLTSFFPEERYVIFALNPRYPLTTQPLMVILGAVSLSCIGGKLFSLSSRVRPWKTVLTWALIALLVFPLLYMGKRMTRPLRRGWVSWADNGITWQTKAMNEGAYQFIATHIPKEKRFLAQSDAMYAYNLRRYVVGDIYPKLLPFYEAHSLNEAIHILHDLNIDYLLIHPGWWPSILSNTHLGKVVADPAWTRLVFQDKGAFVFELLKTPRMLQKHRVWVPTTSTLKYEIRKRKKKNKILPQEPIQINPQEKSFVLNRSIAWTLLLPNSSRYCTACSYVLTGEVIGMGTLNLFARWKFSKKDSYNAWLWHSIFSKSGSNTFQTQFAVPSNTKTLKLVLTPGTKNQKSPLIIKNLKLTCVEAL